MRKSVTDDSQEEDPIHAIPELAGEESVSGSEPAPDSDDDTLENEHQVGLKLDEDEEHPKELDIAGDIDRAEQYHRTH